MEWIKYIHVSCAVISIAGFILRGIWMINESPLLNHRLSKIVPHINDTLLLGSAICLVYLYQMNPLGQPWLLAKMIALLLYIFLGLLAFRFAQTRPKKIAAWLAAILVFIYIAQTAITKNPLVF